MKRYITFSLLTAVILTGIFSTRVEAVRRVSTGLSLNHRSQVEFRLGVRDNTHFNSEYYYDGIFNRYRTGDWLASLGFNHWVSEQTAINFTVKVLAADYEEEVDLLGVWQTSYSVVPIFIGARQYIGQSNSPSPVRPYVALGAGPVLGTENISLVGYHPLDETVTYAAAGAHFGGGIDFLMSRHFMVGVNAGYNLMSDFAQPVGGHVNYSGAEFAVGFGLVF